MTQPFLQLAELLDYTRQVLERGVPGAVWVRADIAQATRKRHLYLELVQRGGGRDLAKCRATCWYEERMALERKFTEATGQTLGAGQAVMLFVTPEFHSLYGFSLNVLDIAPEYTRGEMETRLDAIRARLREDGLYDLARRHALPSDLHRVLVVAPARAAGLGDFKREARRLSGAGVCQFVYLHATFQGADTERSLLSALAQAQDAHQQQPADALIVLRGGGAATDLEQLNSEALAAALARFPAPVLTAIGHARDRTLPDEVATHAFDTPSKAAAWVLGTVAAATERTQGHLRQIAMSAAEAAELSRARADRGLSRCIGAAGRATARERERLAGLMRTVVGLSPQQTLGRGYALASRGGTPIVSAEAARKATEFTLTFADGPVQVRVQPQETP